jgi:hypothetical protein
MSNIFRLTLGTSKMLDVESIREVALLPGGSRQVRAEGAYDSQVRLEPSPVAFARAKRAELIRLAASNQSTIEPNLAGVPADERLILSLPVSLYEDCSTRRPYIPANRAIRKVVWHPRLSTGRKVTIALVDCGTLHLTSRRVIFSNAARRRDFPLDQLTHCSSTWSGIALATAQRRGVSYFRGIGATTINFCVTPERDISAVEHSWKLHGEDLEYVLYLLRTPSSSPLL